jgi:hypothetical protein
VYDLLRVMLCDLTTCYSIESAWFQRLKLNFGELLSNLAVSFKMRRYIWEPAAGMLEVDVASVV